MGVIILLAQCLAMAGASMLVGSLPLMFKSSMSSRSLGGLSVFGMGILVGAALTIIIPEGITTLYEALPASEGHDSDATHAIGLSLLAGFALMLLIESLTPHPPHDANAHGSSDSEALLDNEICADESSSGNMSPPRPRHDSGLPILPKLATDGSHSHAHSAECTVGGSGIQGLSATLGLVIHGAADGIALGASSLSSRADLGLIVFLAVLIHKGPAALGLTTTLLSLHLTPTQVRRRLLLFSLAAPAGAIVTYFLVLAFGVRHSSADVDTLGWWTGIALLFSGGSFLYVATVIQPLSTTSPDDHCHNVHHDNHNSEAAQVGKYARTALILGGMVLPVGLELLVGNHNH